MQSIKSLKDVLSFIVLCSYYRLFIKDFAGIAKPLTNLTKKGQPFVWTDAQERSFQTLKTALTSPQVLAHPNYQLPMELHCDACDYGIGVVLVQRISGEERVLAYASRLLSSAEKNYSITENECLALVWAVQKLKIYLWGTKIRIVTDHHALCWLMRKRDLAGRLPRWSLELQDWDIEIVLRDGVLFQRIVKFGHVNYRLCIPKVLIEQVILACHDDITAGHLGISRTLDKIHQRFFWPKITQCVINYIRSCIDCQTKKLPKELPAGYLTSIRSQRPFEKIGLDLIGPFSLSSFGNRHVIIVVDYFTKWVIAKAVPKATAVEVVDFFV